MFNTITTKIHALSSDRKSVLTLVGGTTFNSEFLPIFGDGFVNICNAIKTLTEKYPEVDFVYSMHLNPNVCKPIREIFGEEAVSGEGKGNQNIFFIEPLEYLSFVFLMEQNTKVLTDSGGIQEEAPGLGKPLLVMRDTTERPEAVDGGTVKLVCTNYDLIVKKGSNLLDDGAY